MNSSPLGDFDAGEPMLAFEEPSCTFCVVKCQQRCLLLCVATEDAALEEIIPGAVRH